MKTGQRKPLYRRERDSLEGLQEHAEKQRKASRRREVGLQQKYMCRKRKSAVKSDPVKSGYGIEVEGES